MDAWNSDSEKRIRYVRETESRALQFVAALAVALVNAEVSRSREAGYLFDDDAYRALRRTAYRGARTLHERQPQVEERVDPTYRGRSAYQAPFLAELERLAQVRRDLEESTDALSLDNRHLTTQERSERAREQVETARRSLALLVDAMMEEAQKDDSSRLVRSQALSLLLKTDARMGQPLTEYDVKLSDDQYQYIRQQLGAHGLARHLPPRTPVGSSRDGEATRPVRVEDPHAWMIEALERDNRELEALTPGDDLATIEQTTRARAQDSIESLSESLRGLEELEAALGAYAPLLLEPWDRQQKDPLQEVLRVARLHEPALYQRLWTLLGRGSITTPALRMDLHRAIEEWLEDSAERKRRLERQKDREIRRLANADLIAEVHLELLDARRSRLAQLKQERLEAAERDRRARLEEEELLLQKREIQLRSDLEHELDRKRWRVLTKQAFQRARDRICPVYPLC